jgi:UDP-3-O-[3-hydroxymyristoyl] glucosamine N-acyltransferase
VAGQVALNSHIRLGDGAQVAAQSGVSKDVEAGQVVRGSPAVAIRNYHREQAAVRKLPEWVERIRALTKRVERLESSADD